MSEIGVPEGWPEESAQRLERARSLQERGVPAYPNRYRRTHRLAEVRERWDGASAESLESERPEVRVSGRVMLLRGHGKLSFATISDGSASLQLFLRRDELGEAGYALLGELDRGDYVGAAGRVMRTRKGELSVLGTELTLLTKALLPPPEKWHGLADVELRYRRRYVDLMVNPEVRRTFERRGRMVREIRDFLDARGYLEVETPMMQPVAGGAIARPFVTHHNALGMDLYLRIAPELYLKRLVVGGLERVYEINRNFRNEGLSFQHNPEFTMLEFYTACFDCDDVVAITEELVAGAMAAGSASPLRYRDREIDFSLPFRKRTMKDAIAEEAGAAGLDLARPLLDDPEGFAAWCSREHRRGGASVGGERYRALSHARRVVQSFEELVEGTLWQPTFILDYPVEVSPLAKRRPGDPEVAERFELFAAGMEIANGFSELNDPLEQRQRFLEQLAQREQGDEEAHGMDEDYVRALGYGLPPTGGCGVGIDRLVMIATDSASIRDVILFPHMRPESGRPPGDEPGE